MKSKLKIIIPIIIVGIVIIGILIIKKNNSNNGQETINNSNNSFTSFENNDIQEMNQANLLQIEINTENWKDYIEITDKEHNIYDDFGDLTKTLKYNEIVLKDNVHSGSMTLKFTPLERDIYGDEFVITIGKETVFDTMRAGFANTKTS